MKQSPFSVAFLPSFEGEGRAFARYILNRLPKAKVAVLAFNEELGRQGLRGLETAFKEVGINPIVAVAWIELNDPTVDSQVLALQASGADVLVSFVTGNNAYAYSAAQAMVIVLKRCGDDLTRENLMRQATSIRDLELPLLLPGIKVNSSPASHRTIKQVQMERFDGSRWVPIGEVFQP